MQEDEQVRAHWRLRQRGAVPDGTVPMPMLPVAQMPRADPARLARMAELAVAEAVGADASLVLIRLDAHRRGVPRIGRRPRRDAHAARKRANSGLFRGLLGVFGGLGLPKKPPGVSSPLRVKALGRSEGVAL